MPQFNLKTIFTVMTLVAIVCAALVGELVPQILGDAISTAAFVVVFLGFLSFIRD